MCTKLFLGSPSLSIHNTPISLKILGLVSLCCCNKHRGHKQCGELKVNFILQVRIHYVGTSRKELKLGTWRQELKRKPWENDAFQLASSWFAQLPFLHLLRGGGTHSEHGPLMLLPRKCSADLICLQGNLMETIFSSQGFLFTGDLSLCQVLSI